MNLYTEELSSEQPSAGQGGNAFCLSFSTPVQVLRALVRLWPLLAPVWRSSALLPSSSVMAVAPATTMLTPTVSGWPPSRTMRCLGRYLQILIFLHS